MTRRNYPNSQWIRWEKGSGRPVDPDTLVEVKMWGMTAFLGKADTVPWEKIRRGSITYRILTADQYQCAIAARRKKHAPGNAGFWFAAIIMAPILVVVGLGWASLHAFGGWGLAAFVALIVFIGLWGIGATIQATGAKSRELDNDLERAMARYKGGER